MIIAFEAGVKYKDKIYFSALNMNGLFSFVPSTKETELIAVFERERIRNWLHCQAFLYENLMWLVPLQAKHIACVDLENKKIEYYDWPSSKVKKEENPFYGGTIVGNELYLIPQRSESFLKINMLSREVSVIACVEENWKDIARSISIYDEKLCVIDNNGEIKVEISLKDGHVEEKGEKGKSHIGGYMSALQKDDEMLMIPFGADSAKKISLTSGDVDMKQLPNALDSFYRGINIGKYAVLYPVANCRRFVVVEWDTLRIRTIDEKLTDGDNYVMAPGGWFEMQTVPADDGWWATSTDGFLIEFNASGEVQNMYHVEYDLCRLKRELDRIYSDHGMKLEFGDASITETEILGLEMLIRYLVDCR